MRYGPSKIVVALLTIGLCSVIAHGQAGKDYTKLPSYRAPTESSSRKHTPMSSVKEEPEEGGFQAVKEDWVGQAKDWVNKSSREVVKATRDYSSESIILVVPIAAAYQVRGPIGAGTAFVIIFMVLAYESIPPSSVWLATCAIIIYKRQTNFAIILGIVSYILYAKNLLSTGDPTVQ